jgi:hypothetical protein
MDKKKEAESLPYRLGEGVSIKLIVAGCTYDTLLRATERNDIVWVSERLTDDSGSRCRLSDVLFAAGFRRNDTVNLKEVGNTITVEPV